MLQLVPHHLKTKKRVTMQLKKLPYLLRFVPDPYKTEEMCDTVIL